MLGGADNPNGELPSYITGANTKETGMARSDYDIINLSLEHELNEWLAERGYAGLADNRNRLAEVVTRKLQDSFYINVSWDALNTAYSEHPEWFSGLVSGDEN